MVRDPRNADRLDLTMPVPGNTLVRLLPDYYAKTLGVPFYMPFDDTRFSRPPTIWCSWTSYYADVRNRTSSPTPTGSPTTSGPTASSTSSSTTAMTAGKGEHYWIENWDKRSSRTGQVAGRVHQVEGPASRPLARPQRVRRRRRAAPRLVPARQAGQDHPGLQHARARLHPPRGPRVPAEALRPRSDDWGFEDYKFDGEHALPRYVPSVDRSRLHDPKIDPLVAYRKRLQVIREAIGPNTFVEGCPAGTPLNGIGYLQLLLQRRRRLQQLAGDVRRSSARSTPTRSGTTWSCT